MKIIKLFEISGRGNHRWKNSYRQNDDLKEDTFLPLWQRVWAKSSVLTSHKRQLNALHTKLVNFL